MAQPTASLHGWLDELQLARFFQGIVEQGCEDVAFLLGLDDEDVRGLCDDVGMKILQKRKLVRALEKLRAAPAARWKQATIAVVPADRLAAGTTRRALGGDAPCVKSPSKEKMCFFALKSQHTRCLSANLPRANDVPRKPVSRSPGM